MTSRKKDAYLYDWKQPVSQYCFGHNQNVLGNIPRAARMRRNVTTVRRGVKSNLHFSWIRGLIRRDVLARLLRRDAKVGFAGSEG